MTRQPEVSFDEAIKRCDDRIDAARDLGPGGEAFERIWLGHRTAYVQSRDALESHHWKMGDWVELRHGNGTRWARIDAVCPNSLYLSTVVTGNWAKSTRRAPRWGHSAWHRKDNARLIRVVARPPFNTEGLLT